MKLTKYEHACFTLEKDGQIVVIDPGKWSTDFAADERVAAVVITHEHPDHFYVETLQAIVDKSPDAVIVAHSDVVAKMPELPTRSVTAGETTTVGPFTLEFFGGTHATIHRSFDELANLGVFIDNTVYYPGDSFVHPDKPVPILALPVTAPWLKISEVIDFLTAVKPQFAFPTHDAIASNFGKGLVDGTLPSFAEGYGGTYQRIDGSIEI